IKLSGRLALPKPGEAATRIVGGAAAGAPARTTAGPTPDGMTAFRTTPAGGVSCTCSDTIGATARCATPAADEGAARARAPVWLAARDRSKPRVAFSRFMDPPTACPPSPAEASAAKEDASATE